MPPEIAKLVATEPVGRWISYAVKAVATFALLILVKLLAPWMPAALIAVLWAVLSAISAIALAYASVVIKPHKQSMYQSNEFLSRRNQGRFLALTIAFVVSAICIAGLILESPTWGLAEWAFGAAAIPLYLVVFIVLQRIFAKQYETSIQISKAARFAAVATGALLTVGYLIGCMVDPAEQYASLAQAFAEAQHPFGSSPSALLSEAGLLMALIDSVTSYLAIGASESLSWVYPIYKTVVVASAFFGISGLLSACILRESELKLIFLPLDFGETGLAVSKNAEPLAESADERPAAQPDVTTSALAATQPAEQPAAKPTAQPTTQPAAKPTAQPQIVKKYAVMACALPLALMLVFAAAEAKTAEIAEAGEFTAAKELIREKAGLIVYLIDGTYYESEKVDELLDTARSESKALAEDRAATLVPLINETFDKRVANVDSYLDWHYSLPADYERLVKLFTGTVEDDMKAKMVGMIEEGVDDSELIEQFELFLGRSEELQSWFEDSLDECELEYSVPEWLYIQTDSLDAEFLFEQMEPTQTFLTMAERMGLSVGVGVVSGVVAAKVAERVMEKALVKKLFAEAVEKMGQKVLISRAGMIAGPIGGAAATVVADYLFLKVDEIANRNAYREQIVGAINEERQSMLDLVAA